MHPETKNNNLQNPSNEPEITNPTDSALNTLSSAIFYLAILFFIIGFNFSDVMVGNWYQQFMPNLNGSSISDITFVDSLNGFATTLYRTGSDSAFILKTTNGGDNWSFNTSNNFPFYKVQFINRDTGYALSFQKLFKTTNKGVTWQTINISLSTAFNDIYVISVDTIWGAASESFTGGVFFTSNGGASWQNQFSSGNQNPNKIYMYNARIGFMSNSSATPNIYKTTNGGVNWNINVSGQYFFDMHFVDSLTGWYSYGTSVYKTTNGGSNWITQLLPVGGIIITTGIYKFSVLNKDTLFGVGGTAFYGAGQFRGMIYKTVNGGQNWLFQVPDTTIHIPAYKFIQFINLRNGWAYSTGLGGIHTTNGGDTTFWVGLHQISAEVPKQFMLFQNYPNPFNPTTNIKYQIAKSNSNVQLSIFDITGREVSVLVNQKQSAGTYVSDWNATGFSSGVYFYSLIVDGIAFDTKKDDSSEIVMSIKNKIKLKTILEACIALLLPVVYFFLIGGFNGSRQNEQNNKPYDPLSVIKTDFVKDIQIGKFDFSGFGTNKQDIDFENNKLKHFLSSQRVVFSISKNSDTSTGEYYFRTVNGYKEKDSIGVNALYLSSGNFVDGRKKMEACYIAEDLNEGVSIKYDSIVSSEWFIKPKMKIRKSDFSPADARTVAAIIIYNFAGKMIDSTVIKVRNFSDLSGKYEGDFIDKYNTVNEMPGNNMRISSIDLFKDMPKKNSGFRIKVFWFGEVDLWFEKIMMDDNIANELLEGKYKEHIIKEITHEDFIYTAIMVKNNMFTKFNFTPINYVMNVMYDYLQTSVEPIKLNLP